MAMVWKVWVGGEGVGWRWRQLKAAVLFTAPGGTLTAQGGYLGFGLDRWVRDAGF